MLWTLSLMRPFKNPTSLPPPAPSPLGALPSSRRGWRPRRVIQIGPRWPAPPAQGRLHTRTAVIATVPGPAMGWMVALSRPDVAARVTLELGAHGRGRGRARSRGRPSGEATKGVMECRHPTAMTGESGRWSVLASIAEALHLCKGRRLGRTTRRHGISIEALRILRRPVPPLIRFPRVLVVPCAAALISGPARGGRPGVRLGATLITRLLTSRKPTGRMHR